MAGNRFGEFIIFAPGTLEEKKNVRCQARVHNPDRACGSARSPPTIAIADTSANPAPLGLLCFALTTVMLSAHNAGIIALDAAIVAMAVFYGGAAQIIAGIFEWRKNNTFASTAFISYGAFWLTIAGIIVFPKLGLADKPNGTTMAVFLGLWGLISFILFIGTLRLNKALQVVFFLLTWRLRCLLSATLPAFLC